MAWTETFAAACCLELPGVKEVSAMDCSELAETFIEEPKFSLI